MYRRAPKVVAQILLLLIVVATLGRSAGAETDPSSQDFGTITIIPFGSFDGQTSDAGYEMHYSPGGSGGYPLSWPQDPGFPAPEPGEDCGSASPTCKVHIGDRTQLFEPILVSNPPLPGVTPSEGAVTGGTIHYDPTTLPIIPCAPQLAFSGEHLTVLDQPRTLIHGHWAGYYGDSRPQDHQFVVKNTGNCDLADLSPYTDPIDPNKAEVRLSYTDASTLYRERDDPMYVPVTHWNFVFVQIEPGTTDLHWGAGGNPDPVTSAARSFIEGTIHTSGVTKPEGRQDNFRAFNFAIDPVIPSYPFPVVEPGEEFNDLWLISDIHFDRSDGETANVTGLEGDPAFETVAVPETPTAFVPAIVNSDGSDSAGLTAGVTRIRAPLERGVHQVLTDAVITDRFGSDNDGTFPSTYALNPDLTELVRHSHITVGNDLDLTLTPDNTSPVSGDTVHVDATITNNADDIAAEPTLVLNAHDASAVTIPATVAGPDGTQLDPGESITLPFQVGIVDGAADLQIDARVGAVDPNGIEFDIADLVFYGSPRKSIFENTGPKLQIESVTFAPSLKPRESSQMTVKVTNVSTSTITGVHMNAPAFTVDGDTSGTSPIRLVSGPDPASGTLEAGKSQTYVYEVYVKRGGGINTDVTATGTIEGTTHDVTTPHFVQSSGSTCSLVPHSALEALAIKGQEGKLPHSAKGAMRVAREAFQAAADDDMGDCGPITVNTNGDQPDPDTSDGVCDVDLSTDTTAECTLRAAIQEANSCPCFNTIIFAIDGSTTITPASPLPEITEPLSIDGTTQQGGRVEVQGPGTTGDGLVLNTHDSTIKGLVINKWETGVKLSGTGGHTIENNWFGLNKAGTGKAGGLVGVDVSSPGNTIKGNTFAGLGDRALAEQALKHPPGDKSLATLKATVRTGGGGVFLDDGASQTSITANRFGSFNATDSADSITGLAVGVGSFATDPLIEVTVGGPAAAANKFRGGAFGVLSLKTAGALTVNNNEFRKQLVAVSGSGPLTLDISDNDIGRSLVGVAILGAQIHATVHHNDFGSGTNASIVGVTADDVNGAEISLNSMPATGLGIGVRGSNNVIKDNTIGSKCGTANSFGNLVGGSGISIGNNLLSAGHLTDPGAGVGNRIEHNTICGQVAALTTIGSSQSQILDNTIAGNLFGLFMINAPDNVIGGPGKGNNFDLTAVAALIGGDMSDKQLDEAGAAGDGTADQRLVGQLEETDTEAEGALGGLEQLDTGPPIVVSPGAGGNTIQANKFGTSGQNGFSLLLGNVVDNTKIGGSGVGEGNIFGQSKWGGIWLVPKDAYAAHGVSIRANTFTGNGDGKGLPLYPGIKGVPIDLVDPNAAIEAKSYGVTKNDDGDADEGVNGLQNFPEISDVQPMKNGTVKMKVVMNSSPNSTFAIDVYANAACHFSKHGEGARYLGSVQVATDGSGKGSVKAHVSSPVAKGEQITGTATDPSGNTSEFSECAKAAKPKK